MRQGEGKPLFAFSILHHSAHLSLTICFSQKLSNFFSSFLIIVYEVSSPLIICVAFLWILPSSAVSFLRLGNQKHIQHSRWDSTTDLYHGITILSVLFTILFLILQNIMSAFLPQLSIELRSLMSFLQWYQTIFPSSHS